MRFPAELRRSRHEYVNIVGSSYVRSFGGSPVLFPLFIGMGPTMLLLSDEQSLNGRLAKIYGANMPPDAPFRLVRLDPTERAGVLTQPYLMASFAHVDTSSPIHRGVLIARSLLG